MWYPWETARLIGGPEVFFIELLSLQGTPETDSPSACLELGCPDMWQNIILGGSPVLSGFRVWTEVLALLEFSCLLVFRLELTPRIAFVYLG